MVLIKNLKFFLFLFFGKIGQKVFGDAVGRKLAYLVYKNIDLRKSQNLHFSKKKLKFFLFVFFLQIVSEMLKFKTTLSSI